ncbi:M1 family metallopeptidase [Telluria aromaticivorans]|uniref:M1 family metallopeptidase n=1 Tax=Telluria aromaticivorans TaxID=2725995 RepID=A0A7Y2P1H1_9BURK|nr:M1 family metallopeptidase [Telluria aromaticivorans]NNG24551.1 M1 family metallopeptidase [Telluria aromaticivorans]
MHRQGKHRGLRTAVLAALLAIGGAGAWFAQADMPAAAVPPSLDGIALAAPDAAAVTVPSRPDAWGGMRTATHATLSDRVANYRIEATLDPVKHVVTGRQQLSWRNRSAVPVRSVYVHLYMNAFEGEGSTFHTEQRQRGERFRSGQGSGDGDGDGDGKWGHIALRSVTQGGAQVAWHFVQPDNGPPTDHTVARFDLPQAVAPGATTTFDMAFTTQLPRVTARTGYFDSFHLVAQWFPKIAVLELPGERGATAPRWNAHEFHMDSEFYADFGSYDVSLTVPKGYTVGATGELQGAPAEKNGQLTHRYVQHDVHDFAWTADKRSAAPLVETWNGPGSPPVTVRVLYPLEYAASAKPAMKAARDALAWFSRTLGPYPYRTLTVVIPPFNAQEAGGMEYPTFITASGYAEVPAKSLAEYELDGVTIHEFGHGYFYGILANNEFEEPMLDEGLNEYWDTRMLRERGQQVHPLPQFLQGIGVAPAFAAFDTLRMASPRDKPADAPGQNAWRRLQGIGPVYTRSATVLRDLEARIGSAAMERGFKEYYRRWQFRHPSIADFREALADGSGARAAVEDVFAKQVYATSRVDDRVSELSSDEALPLAGTRLVDGKRIGETGAALDKRIAEIRKQWEKANPAAKKGTGPFPWHTQVTVRREGASVPQTLLVKFEDGSSETVDWHADEKWRTFSWTRTARAVSAELDPRRNHYLDVNKLDDSRTMKPDGSASTRWGSEAAALYQLILSFIATV